VVGRFALFSVKIDDVSYLGYGPETHRQHFAQSPSGVRPRGTGLDGLGPLPAQEDVAARLHQRLARGSAGV
jgi:hypothetical protein